MHVYIFSLIVDIDMIDIDTFRYGSLGVLLQSIYVLG